MSKMKKLIVVMMLMVVSLFTTKTSIFANEYRGEAVGTQATVGDDGKVAVTYTFTTADGEIDGLAGVFSWDDNLLTLDGEPKVKNMVMSDWGVSDTTREYHGQIDTFGPVCEVTFNFKQTKLNETTPTTPIKFTFTDVDLSHQGKGVLSEFYDTTFEPMLPSEINYIEAQITYNSNAVHVDTNEIQITAEDKVLKAGDKQQFKVDAKDVKWTIEGATSKNTKIDKDGMLQIGDDESATSLIIKASKDDEEVSMQVDITKESVSKQPKKETNKNDNTLIFIVGVAAVIIVGGIILKQTKFKKQ